MHNLTITDDSTTLSLSKEYKHLLAELKNKIKTSRLKASLAINKELIHLYWYIGQQIVKKQQVKTWGTKLVENLAMDLRNAFPETKGFSVPNLKRMRLFAQTYPLFPIGSQSVSQLPWGHISILIYKVKDEFERDWYCNKIIEEGWSRQTFERFLNQDLYQRQAIGSEKITNYLECLPHPHSALAHDIIKQPYNLDFLGLHDDALEREIEHASIDHIVKFMLELGRGFAFVGRQVPFTLQESEYFIDMLFYHLKLHCYVVIEIKAAKFKPEHTGQLNFYLNLVDDFYKTSEDNPTIGLLLCKSRNQYEAEYALKGINKPIGISEYELTKSIPDKLKADLPSIEEIETELNAL